MVELDQVRLLAALPPGAEVSRKGRGYIVRVKVGALTWAKIGPSADVAELARLAWAA